MLCKDKKKHESENKNDIYMFIFCCLINICMGCDLVFTFFTMNFVG